MGTINMSQKHVTRYLSLLLIAIALSMLWFSTANAQSPSLELTKSIEGDPAEIESGVPFRYHLSYRCASITQDCEGAFVTDALPDEVEYLSLVTTPHVDFATYDAPSHTVTFTFIDPLPAGSTGILQINVQFPPGTTPGTTATNDATIDAGNGSPSTTAPVSIDSTGVFEMFPQKSLVGEAVEGFPTIFEVAVCSPDSSGGVNLTNPVFVDELPDDATFVTAEGTEGVDWVYDSGEHTVTFMNLPMATVGACLSRTLSVQYDTIPTPVTQTNTLTVTGTPEGCEDAGNLPAYCEGQTERTLGPVGLDFDVIAPYSEGSGSKSSSSPSSFLGTEALPGEAITYTVGVENSGFLTLTNVILTDTIPAEVEVSSFTIGPASAATASGFYQSDQTSGWQPFPANPYGANTTINVTDLGLAGGDFVTALRWEIGDLPVSTSWSADVHTTVLAGILAGTTFQNCADVSGSASDGDFSSQSCDNASVIDQRAIPRTRKSVDPGPYLPGDTAVFTARIQNDGVAHLDLENPVIVDLLPAQFEFITGTYTVTSAPAGGPNPNFTSISDYNGTGQHLLRWEWNDQSGSGGTDARYSLAPGEEFVVEFEVEIVDGTAPDRYQNHVAITGWDGPTNTLLCEDSAHPESSYTDTGDLDDDGDSSEIGCQNANDEGFLDVGVFLQMDSEKSVRGQLDSDWNKLGLTIPGGTVDYRLVITNTSNVSVTNLITYDILPYIGDTGVIDSSNRESEWRPNLQGPVTTTDGTPLTVYYSVSQNPCRPEVVSGGPASCVDDWTTTLPDDPTAVQALKFDFCDGGTCLELARNSSVEVIWPMVAPNEAPTDPSCSNAFDPNDPLQFKTDNPACEIAWNSFGFTAEHEASGLNLPAAEPIKVGIRVTDDANLSIGDFVWLDIAGIQNDGIQQPEEAGINGVRVELYDADTDTFLDYRITGPNDEGEPGYYLFSDLSAGNYYVRFFAPDNYTTSPANQLGDDAVDSDGETAGTDPTYGDYLQSTDIALSADDMTWDQGMWVEVDYGDAPNPYPTEASSIISPSLAARHIIVDGIHLGADVDAELDGQPNAAATGDDADGNDDEDGVTFQDYLGTTATPSALMVIGEDSTIDISATVPPTMTGYLNAWLDFNGDGDWDDAGEQIATNVSPSAGAINLTVSVPSNAQLGTSYARFRFGTQQDLTPTGTASDGEVEDYQVQFISPPVKSIVTSSQEHTNGNTLAIGEIVRYQLAVSIPEGTLSNFTITDNLPTGLQFLDDSTTTVAISATTTVISDGLTISGAPFNNGTNPVFILGTVINNDTDTDEEFILIAFNALVVNSNTNDHNDTLDNSFDVSFDSFLRTSNTETVTLLEPAITNLNKQIITTPNDAGDTVVYQVTYSNSGATVAFNVTLSDTLDSLLTLNAVSASTTGDASGITNNSTGNNVNLTLETVPMGSGATIVYTATLNSAIIPGNAIPNVADLVYSSLPGDNGTSSNPTGSTTPGNSGDSDGERNGSGGTNDYNDSDNASLTVDDPLPTKTLVSTSESHTTEVSSRENLAIGEVARFRLEVQLPEGSSPWLQLRDRLPTGLQFLNDNTATVAFVANGPGITSTTLIPGSIGCAGTLDVTGDENSVDGVSPTCVLPDSAVGSNSSNSSDTDSYNSGTDVYFKLGTVVNNDNDADPEFVIVEFNALVLNELGNQSGDTFENSFDVRIDNDNDNTSEFVVRSNNVPLRIAEPELALAKLLSSTTPDAGDRISYTLSYTNTASDSAATVAFDVQLSDTLNSSYLTLDLSSINIVTSGTLTNTVDNSAGNTVSVIVDGMEPGANVTVEYAATLNNAVMAGQMITNTANLVYTSLPGDGTTGNPTGSDTPGGSGDSDGERNGDSPDGVNDYAVSDSEVLIVDQGTLGKALFGTSAAHTTGDEITIGEVITYSLVISVPEGTVPSIQVIDELPEGLAYVDGSVTVNSSSFNGSVPAPTVSNNGGSGDDVTIDFGAVTVNVDNNPSNNSFMIQLATLVLDVPGNVGTTPGQSTLTNNATVQIGSGTPQSTNPVDVTVVEPQMEIVKTMTPRIARIGDTVTVTLAISNTGTSTAFEVIMQDVVPTGMSYNAATMSQLSGPAVVLDDGSAPTLSASWNTFAVGEISLIQFQATIDNDPPETIINTATVNQATTLPGPSPNERDEPDVQDSDSVTIPVIVGDRVWYDNNFDGQQDSVISEPGVPGVLVTVYDATTNQPVEVSPGVPMTDITDENGDYLFDELPVGNYYVVFDLTTLPAGYIPTTANQGDDATDSDVDNNGQSASTGPLAAGAEDLTLDLGIVQPAAIGNYVWVDENNDGYQDAGEAGIANVIIELWDATHTTLLMTTTTDANGGYLFDDLVPGTYQVDVDETTLPAGMTQTALNLPNADFGNQDHGNGDGLFGYEVTVGAGEENLTADFGYNHNPNNDVDNPTGSPNAALGDQIWIDSDGDGVQDPNEVGVSGIEVTLYHDPDGDGVYDTPYTVGSYTPTTTTDDNGNYLFDDLPAGAYVVGVTDSSSASADVLNSTDYAQTGDPDHFATDSSNAPAGTAGDNLSTQPIVLAPGDVFLNADFGYQPQGSAPVGTIGNTIWFDADADGVGPSTVNSDPAGNGNPAQTGGADDNEYGIFGVTVALIEDSNGNGTWDAGEPIIATDVTDANGQYLFEGLPLDDGDGDADYIVWVNDTDNVLDALRATYDADGESDSNGEQDASSVLGLSAVSIDGTDIAGGSNSDSAQDFGYTPNGHQNGEGLIGDTIFRDDDGSGTPDDGEGLEGVLVTLTDSTGAVITTITDENGHYWFGNLDPSGTYTVTVDTNTLPGGLSNSVDPDGGNDSVSVVDLSAGTDGNNDPDGIDNGINLGQDFGYVPAGTAGSIGNLVWLDQNADGINDGVNGPDGIASTDDDEPGIFGVTVSLYHDANGNGQVDAGEPLMGSTTTDANGNYLFSNLPVDDGGGDMAYVVDVTDSAGVLAGYWHSLGAQAQSSDDTSKTDAYPVTLTDAVGQRDVLTADFGYYVEPAALGNYVWLDIDRNGTQEASEQGLANVEVVLTINYADGTTITMTTTTDANGHYSFANLLADEDYNGAGAGEPTFTISVDTNQAALSNYVPTIINTGSDLTDSDNHSGVSANPVQGLLDVSAQSPASGEPAIASYDFGFYAEYGAIGNYIWVDENSDGYQDAGEAGIPNVIVTLIDSSGTVYTTVTDANGYYLFGDLVSDTYTVTVSAFNFATNGALSGMEQTALTAGGNTADPAYDGDFGNKDDAGYAISLGAGEENLTADFGYNYNPSDDVDNPTGSPNAVLGDRIWVDSDGDGVQDANEIGVSGVEVTLYHDPDGDGVYNTPYTVGGYTPTTTTDSNGNYLFDDLPAGAYVVGVTDSSSASHDVLNNGTYDQTGDPDHFGTDASNAPSGTAGDNLSTQPIVLAPGDVFLNADFGYQPNGANLGSIGDTIFFDADADGDGPSLAPVDGGAPVTQGAGGTADSDDYGIPGVSVSLIGDSNGNGIWDAGEPIIATDVTDANGQYLFSNLPISDGAGSDDYLVWVNDTNNVLDALSPSYDADGLNTPTSGVVSGANISAVSDLDSTPVRNQDFGYTPLGQDNGEGAIGDTIWFDIDGSGGATQDAGEPGIEGIVVTLTDANGNVIATTTDENGHYYFGALDPTATYTVTIAPENFQAGGVLEGMSETYDPDGNTASQSVVNLNSSPNGIDLAQDFSYRGTTPHGLGNLVWMDLDADGTYDPADGETPIGGVTVDLYRDLNGNGVLDAGEPLMGTTITSASIDAGIYGTDGNYIFDGLPDGDYIVDVTDVDGLLTGYWHSDGPNDGSDNNSQVDPYAVTISGADNLTADFGYYVLPAAVGNYVWEDSDGDGIQDDFESGIPNVVVTLVVDYPDGTSVTVNTTTDANGHYSFGNLLLDEDYNNDGAGEPTFTVSVDTNQAALSSYITTIVDVNGNGNDLEDSDNPAGVAAEPIQGQTNTDALNPVTNEPVIASQDFGFQRDVPGAIGNYIWVDENSDGLQDAGEAGIPNVIVNLTDSSGTVYSTSTDASGHYLFPDLSTDTYTVTIPALNSGAGGALEGMTQTSTYPSPGDDLNNQNLNGGSGYVISLGVGEENLTADFGYNYNPTDDVTNPTGSPTAALGDRIWVDVDGDGVQDPNEIGVEGVTVNLYSDPDGDGVYDTPAGTTTTDANGNYLFDGLTPAGYVVEVVTSGSPVDGWTQTGDPDEFGSTASSPDNRTTSPIVLAPGDVFLNADFGYTPPASTTGSIGDTVWFDADASGTGTVDAGEYGIAGVTVALIKDSNGDGIWTPLGADGLPGTADDEPIIGSDTTDLGGNYLFSGLPLDDAGGDNDADYLVWVNDTDNVLDALVQTYDADGTGTPDISATAISSGTPDSLNQDFSYTPEGHVSGQGLIGDTIFLDYDGSGTPSASEGLEGVTVTLTDAAGNLISTITDENGNYWFGNLDPNGTYTVTVDTNTLPVGLTNSVDPDGGNNSISVVDLSAGTDGNNDPDGIDNGINLGQDFGYTPAGTAGSIGNLVWLDQNADGINDGVNGPDGIANTDDDELGIAGVTIDLYHDVNGNGQVDAGEPLMGSSTTDGSGNYLFSNLPVDDGSGDMAYVVDITDEAGILAGYWHSLGDQAQTSDDTSKSDSYPVTLVDGDGLRDVLTADFGYYVEPAAVGNYVWYDENTDGLQDSNEVRISGIPVTLTISYPNNDPITLVTTTDLNGHYSFDNLLLDEGYNGDGSGQEPTYSISVGIPTGYTATTFDVNTNGNDLEDSDDHNGVNALPVQGQIDTTAVNPVTNEPLIASYDFGLISTLDFGDLPASYSATQLGEDGPRHTVGSLHLGALVDADGDGEPDDTATGDDDLDGSDDEDGLIPTSGVRWQVGPDGASIDVSVTGTGGVLSLWIDWNQDGDFDEANERVLLDRSVAAGSETIAFDVPNGVNFNGDLNLRARLYDATTSGAASPIGYSGGVGEVEDYQWNFAALSVNLGSFQATCQSNQVMITWETVSELNNLGFNVYRSTSLDGTQSQVNDSLIPTQRPGSAGGAYYEWLDSDIESNTTYYYWIEDLDTGGITTRHGPVSACGMVQIYLPVIQR